MKYSFIAFAMGCLATPLAAQDGTGSITGTLNLDDARWVVASAGEGPTSSYSQSEEGTRIVIVATPDPEATGGPGTLTLEIDAKTCAVEARATDARVELKRADETLFAESENLDLSLTAYQQVGEDLAITGSFIATMTPDEQDGIVVRGEDVVTLDGNFQATIPVAEGG